MDDSEDLLFRFRASYQKQDGTVEITSRAVSAGSATLTNTRVVFGV